MAGPRISLRTGSQHTISRHSKVSYMMCARTIPNDQVRGHGRSAPTLVGAQGAARALGWWYNRLPTSLAPIPNHPPGASRHEPSHSAPQPCAHGAARAPS